MTQESISCNDPTRGPAWGGLSAESAAMRRFTEGSCTIILHRRSMRLCRILGGLQGKPAMYGGKRAALWACCHFSNKPWWCIRSGSEPESGAEFSQGKAADAGGLSPVKDNNDAMRKFHAGYDLISDRMCH